MRKVTKTISLPVGEETMEFRLTKLNAFAGVRLLKLLSHAGTEDLREALFSLPQAELDSLMETCLASVSALLPAGPIRILEDGNWGIPDLEYDGWTCLKLTMETINWTLEGFFPESGSAS